MGVLVYLCSVVDAFFLVFKKLRNERAMTIARVWSANFNTYKLMRYKPTSDRMDAVDDIRYIFAIATTLIHSFACAVDFRVMAKISRLEWDFQSKFYEFWMQPFFNTLGIEAFFCIG